MATFTVADAALDPHNGQPADGLTCDAFNEETWFPSSSPAANTPEPGTPDATDTSGLLGASGVAGRFLITVPKAGSYWVATYNSWDPTVIAWVKILSHPHTNLVGWTGAVSAAGTKHTATSINIASGSNGAALPQSTIFVTSTTGLPTSGFFVNSGLLPAQFIAYTSITGGATPSFNGCTGGAGTLATGQSVQCPIYQAGNYRRFVTATAHLVVPASAVFASLQIYGVASGNYYIQGQAQLGGNTSAAAMESYGQVTAIVDPLGYYLVFLGNGGGTATLTEWVEVDF